MKYIALGKFNKYNIYILISFLCEFLMDLLFGLNSSNKKKPARFFSFRAKIKDHALLDNFIRISSIFFGGIILYFVEKTNKLKNNKEISIEDYEKLKSNIFKEKSSAVTLDFVFIGIVFSLYIILKDFISLASSNLGLWSFEIMYICIFSRFIFKSKIYKHIKIAIYIMLVIAVSDFLIFVLPFTKHENTENKNELTDKNVFDKIIIRFGAYAIPLIFIANEIKHIQRDYCWIKAKYLMDIKSYPPYKIFLSIGCIGILFIITFFSIFTYVPCKTFNNIDIIGNNYFYNNSSKPIKLYLEYCPLKDYDENTKTLYLFYDSMKLISREYSNIDKENMLEIFLLIPLYFIFNLVNEVSRLMIVRYTDPNNIIVYKNFYYFMKRIIQIIINKGDEQYITYIQFFILEFEELIGIIGCLIYIEVLELKFCGFDYELKKNIYKRSFNDFIEGFNMMKKEFPLEDIKDEDTQSSLSEK